MALRLVYILGYEIELIAQQFNIPLGLLSEHYWVLEHDLLRLIL